MDVHTRRTVENHLAMARKAHAAEAAEMKRHLHHLDDAEYSSAAWRNLAITAAAGSFYAGRVDALKMVLDLDDAEKASNAPAPTAPKE